MQKIILLLKLFLLSSITLLLVANCSATTSPASTPHPASTQSHSALIYYSDREDDVSGVATDGIGGIYLFDSLTKEEVYLTEGKFLSQSDGFSWSPVTQKLLYTDLGGLEIDENDIELYLLDLDGSATQLTDNNFTDSNGRWSPDGQSIVFWSNRSDDSWFYLMNPDGTNVRPLFDDESTFLFGSEIVWSPDSQKLAISTSNPMGFVPDSVVIVELESKKVISPLPDDRIRSDFDWSHGSDKLVFLSDPVPVCFCQTKTPALFNRK